MRIETAEHVEAAHREDQFLRDGRPEIAFVGRSNVGKSSLLNRLLGRKGLARISSTPGRTRAVHYYLVNGRSYFVDLPGYGYAKVSKSDRAGFAELVDRYFQRSRRPEERFVVVLLVDGKVGATPLDRQAREYFEAHEVPHLVVATKVDKLPRSSRARALAGVRTALGLSAEEPAIAVSAETGEGIAELWKEIGGVLRP